MIKTSNSVKSSHTRQKYQKKFYGNYLGIVVQNDDPDHRGRIKIYVPHVTPSVYENWDAIIKDKKFKFIGDNIDSFVNLIPGEILYGNFSGIVNHTDSTAVCIAYRG